MRLLLDPFAVPFMRRALAEALLLGVLGGAVGVAVVLRRLAFYGEVLSHTVFPGVVLAAILGWPLPLGALVFALLTAALVAPLGASRRVGADASLAIVMTAMFAVGVALVSLRSTFATDLTLLLFGRLLAVGAGEVLLTAAVGAAVLVTLGLLSKELVLRAFDPGGAAALGYRTVALDLVLNLCVALVVVVALEAVGTMLVLAFLVIPAVAARLVTERIATMTLVACALGALGGWLGLAASFQASVRYGLRVGSAAAVVAVLVACFLACLALAPVLRRVRARAAGGARAAAAGRAA
ncbi:MAG TPA: metal ABC transporter permease [Actinomycetes bacterium]|nr:metal ABC transporter permease [Actinomycetes bacterium]